EQKRRQAELERLKKDDEVVTIGGIFGTVVNLSEDRKEVTLKIADNTRVRVLRSAIQSLVNSKSDGTKTA
ncbi:MAG: preprotein translocase subunit YajC, partial [Planctomycetaceae bacterium]